MDIDAFFENFKPTDIAADPLPLKVLNHSIESWEVRGQTMYWAFQYLYQKNCPSSIITPLLKEFSSEMAIASLDDCTKEFKGPENNGEETYYQPSRVIYKPLKLMQAVAKHIDDVIMKFKERESQFTDKILAPYTPPDLEPYIFEVSFCTMKNTRRSLEDRMIILPYLDKIYECQLEASYFAVFDGHNGVEAAAYAAAQLHQCLINDTLYLGDIPAAITQAFANTDRNFLDKCETENIRSGATAVLALVDRHKIYVAWAGDSQAVLVKSNETISLVSPHKPEREDEMKRIRDVGGDVLLLSGTWRVNGNLAVSRAIGDYDYKSYIVSTPEIRTVDRDEEDEFLILACDGLWDDISPQRSAKIVRDYLGNNGQDLDGLSQALASEAKKEGCGDNITIIVVFLKPVQDLINSYKQVDAIFPVDANLPTIPTTDWSFSKLNPDANPFTMDIENLEPEKMDVSTNNLEEDLLTEKIVDVIDAPLDVNCTEPWDEDADKLLDAEVLSQPDEDWKFQASYPTEVNASAPVNDELEYLKSSTNPFLQEDLSQEINNASYDAQSINDTDRLIQFEAEDKGNVIQTNTLEGPPADESAMLLSLESAVSKEADLEDLQVPMTNKNQSENVEVENNDQLVSFEAEEKENVVLIESEDKEKLVMAEAVDKQEPMLLEVEDKEKMILIDGGEPKTIDNDARMNSDLLGELSADTNFSQVSLEQEECKLADLGAINTPNSVHKELEGFSELQIDEKKVEDGTGRTQTGEPLEVHSLLGNAELKPDFDITSQTDYLKGISTEEKDKLLRLEQANDVIVAAKQDIKEDLIEDLQTVESDKLSNLESVEEQQKNQEIMEVKEKQEILESAENKLKDPETPMKPVYLDKEQSKENEEILEGGEAKLNATNGFTKSEIDCLSNNEKSPEVPTESLEVISKSAAVADVAKSPIEVTQPVSEAKVGSEAKTVKAATNEKIKLGVKSHDSKKPVTATKSASAVVSSTTKRPVKAAASPSAKNVASSPTTTTASKSLASPASSPRTAPAKTAALSKPTVTSPRVTSKTLPATQKHAVAPAKSTVSSTSTGSIAKPKLVEKKPPTAAASLKSADSVPRVRSAPITTAPRPMPKTGLKTDGATDAVKKDSRPARPATSLAPKTATQARPSPLAAPRPKPAVTTAAPKPKPSGVPSGSSSAASSRTAGATTASKLIVRKEISAKPASAVTDKKPTKLEAGKTVPLAKKTVAKSIIEPKKTGGGSTNKLPVTRPTANKVNAKDPKLPLKVNPISSTKSDDKTSEVTAVNGQVEANGQEISKSDVTANGQETVISNGVACVTNNEPNLPNGGEHGKVEMIDFGASLTEGNNGVVTNGKSNEGGGNTEATSTVAPNLMD